MLGEPLELGTPSVVGVRLSGALREGVTATDLVLTLTELLRAPRRRRALRRVLRRRPLGALARRPRDALQHVARVRRHRGALPGRRRGAALPARDRPRRRSCRSSTRTARSRACSGATATPRPTFSTLVELDLDGVAPSLAGPRRPQDRVPPRRRARPASRDAYPPRESTNGKPVHDGDVVIAAITSCTNTSNPSVMVAAGLLARNAVARGLTRRAARQDEPRARLARRHRLPRGRRPAGAARRARLPARRLRLHDLHRQLGPALGRDLAGRARRRAGRLRRALGQPQLRGPHPPARARELPRLSPARRRLRARRLDLGRSRARAARHRRATAPTSTCATSGPRAARCARRSRRASRPSCSSASTRRSGTATSAGARCPRRRARCSTWDPDSTYVREPSFFQDLQPEPEPLTDIEDARCLVVLGDSVTTDHISPGRRDPARHAGRPLPARARRRAARLQLLRRAPRQPRGHGARHVRQHPPAQRARRRPRGRLHGAPALRRPAHDLRRGRALPRRGRAARRARRQGVRLGLVARLGRQGHAAARHPRRHRRELRAHPPLQPRRHGRAAAGVRRRPDRRVARPRRPRALHDPRHRRRRRAAASA